MTNNGRKEFNVIHSIGENVEIVHGFYNKGKGGVVTEIRITSELIEYKVDVGEITSYYYKAEDIKSIVR